MSYFKYACVQSFCFFVNLFFIISKYTNVAVNIAESPDGKDRIIRIAIKQDMNGIDDPTFSMIKESC
jgi:hypothetical protein